jgi:hypothetical protein
MVMPEDLGMMKEAAGIFPCFQHESYKHQSERGKKKTTSQSATSEHNKFHSEHQESVCIRLRVVPSKPGTSTFNSLVRGFVA